MGIPSGEMYELSYIHKDVVTHVVAGRNGYLISACADVQIQIWKKGTNTDRIDFVVAHNPHDGRSIRGLSINSSGRWCCTIANDHRFVMIIELSGQHDVRDSIELSFQPGAVDWLFGHQEMWGSLNLAVSDSATPKIHICNLYLSSRPTTYYSIVHQVHSSPIKVMKYNESNSTMISADVKGIINIWYPSNGNILHEIRRFVDATPPSTVSSIEVSPKGDLFSVATLNYEMTVFRCRDGILMHTFNTSFESVEQYAEPDTAMDATLRLGLESLRERERELQDEAITTPINGVFDKSSNWLIYSTPLHIVFVNLQNGRILRLGKKEKMTRFLQVALCEVDDYHPYILCCAYKKHRVYIFSNQEHTRFQEMYISSQRPNYTYMKKEFVNISFSNPDGGMSNSRMLIQLFSAHSPDAVSIFKSNCMAGYYCGILARSNDIGLEITREVGQENNADGHPTGEVVDEFKLRLRHDREYVVSTTQSATFALGDQILITEKAAHWLDEQNIVIGRVVPQEDISMNEEPYEGEGGRELGIAMDVAGAANKRIWGTQEANERGGM